MSSLLWAQAPGSVMLMGEHAVLHGGACMVAAVEPSVRVEITMRHDQQVVIQSAMAGTYSVAIDALIIEPPYDFILAALYPYIEQLDSGIQITVQSSLSSQHGFGSSAAVTVAMVACLRQRFSKPMDKHLIHQEAFAAVMSVQGCGSGADLAASCFGGLLFYQHSPTRIEKMDHLPHLAFYYCGYKTKTAHVLEQVASQACDFPRIHQALYQLLDQIVHEGRERMETHDWAGLGRLFDIHQGLQTALGVSNADLNRMLEALRASDHVLGAKISGAGLGDCVVALLEEGACEPELSDGSPMIPFLYTREGLQHA